MDSSIADVVNPFRRGIVVSGIVIAGIVVAVLLLGALPGAGADSEGVNSAAGGDGWATVFTETFESGISAGWLITDENGTQGGEYYWATSVYTHSQGAASVWATGGGTDGGLLDPEIDSYPDSALSWMIYGPVDLTGTTSARLTFDRLLDTQVSLDVLQVMASTEGGNPQDFDDVLTTLSGNSQGWEAETLDVSNLAGEDQVWIAFLFSSNASGSDGKGVFVDNVGLYSMVEQRVYLPAVRKEPTPTPTPTPTPSPTPEFHYHDGFGDPESGWSTVYHPDPQDWYHWFYSNGEYHLDIKDDRTDVKSSPGVELPDGDYVIEVDARFRYSGGWWTAYGILFDAKDDPDPNKSDLGDYFMLWVLWEGAGQHKWGILRDYTGGQDAMDWGLLDSQYYNYGSDGLAWNHWKIVRTANDVTIYCNGALVGTSGHARPTTNYQVLFGLYGSTYETNYTTFSWDDYEVYPVSGRRTAGWDMTSRGSIVVSGDFTMDALLPHPEE
jgi:hypothetical protein